MSIDSVCSSVINNNQVEKFKSFLKNMHEGKIWNKAPTTVALIGSIALSSFVLYQNIQLKNEITCLKEDSQNLSNNFLKTNKLLLGHLQALIANDEMINKTLVGMKENQLTIFNTLKNSYFINWNSE